jgi:hypothetical protein
MVNAQRGHCSSFARLRRVRLALRDAALVAGSAEQLERLLARLGLILMAREIGGETLA